VAEQLAAQLGARVGVGDARASLSLARESVNEARQALDVADRLPGLAPVARWSELGIYRVLSTVDLSGAHPGAAKLLAAPVLAETLETYLDLAGDAAATAGRLNLHRTTLYYRLRRIEELTGADLRDGQQRLGLHLSLKSARFLVD
jgi:DNA-binding PucR family transcriptional regulator